MNEDQSWAITAQDVGARLDSWLAQRLAQPRNQVSRWIAADHVRVNGQPAKASTALRSGDVVHCSPPQQGPDPRLEPEPGDLEVLHEDPDLIVIDKAAGVAVHPGAGRTSGTLAHFLLHRFPEIAGIGGPGRPGIVHRLDIDTTGALVVARSEAAYQGLAAAFAERRIRKTYLAIAYGTPRENPGRIEQPIGRHRHMRKQMQVRRDGRPAVTRYRTLESSTGISRIEVDLETGRTHQIRVHLKSIGHPLVGDPVYGEARWRNLPRPVQRTLREFGRPALHAWRLAFRHPTSGVEISVEAPTPVDLLDLWHGVTGHEWRQQD